MRQLKLFATVISAALIFMMLPHSVSASYGWGYKKNTDHTIPDVGKYKQMLEQYGAYYADHSGDKHIYLTFDNGYEAGYTEDVLNVLKEENVPATFFVTGHYVKSEPDMIKRMVEEGHIVGNHSYHHPDFTVISKQSMKEELETLEAAVANVSDQKSMTYLRPPRGTFSEKTLSWAAELGYTHVFWSLAFIDWNTDKQKGWEYAYEQVIDQIHPGAIMLLHAVSSDNAEALSQIIQDLKAEGYTFKSLDDLVLKDMLPPVFLGW
ncbi:delta-lactam-biosynthetic de-N-acetylase [Lentibacillus saliphilus]|uniref:delta-lactam-biosynthetic de-N-acetylase n=1 Tax=Lentibacillus saliphilus TaxID=2737028 RepID=UPI001C300AE5|nr:delta-lactam-biosynthetic de-N-acetylase [Lentibacillus saliphilus]